MAGFDSGGIILYSGDGGRLCFQLRPFLKGCRFFTCDSRPLGCRQRFWFGISGLVLFSGSRLWTIWSSSMGGGFDLCESFFSLGLRIRVSDEISIVDDALWFLEQKRWRHMLRSWWVRLCPIPGSVSGGADEFCLRRIAVVGGGMEVFVDACFVFSAPSYTCCLRGFDYWVVGLGFVGLVVGFKFARFWAFVVCFQ